MRVAALLFLFLLGAVPSARSEPPASKDASEIRCAISLHPAGGWSETEIWTWDRLCRGIRVRLDERDTEALPCNPSELRGAAPSHRRLSARFLELILTHDAFSSALAVQRISIACADVTGRLNLENAHVPVTLELIDSRSVQGAVLSHARFDQSVILSGSTFVSRVSAQYTHFAGDLRLDDGAAFHEQLVLSGSKIGGDLDASTSVFGGTFSADNAQVGGSLLLQDGASFEADLLLHGLKIGGELTIAGSSVAGLLDVSSTDIKGGVLLHSGARFLGDVLFSDLRSLGDFNADSSSFAGSIDLDGGRIDGDVFLRKVEVEGATVLAFAQVGGTVVAEQATFGQRFNARGLGVERSVLLRNGTRFRGRVQFDGATIRGALEIGLSEFERRFQGAQLRVENALLIGGGTRFRREVLLTDAEIKGDLRAAGATFDKAFGADGIEIDGNLSLWRGAAFNAVSLKAARIGGALQLNDGRFEGAFDMSGAQVEGELRISSSPRDVPRWGREASLNLRNASAAAVLADLSGWRRDDGSWLPTKLSGFAYESLHRLQSGVSEAPTSMSDASPALLIEWIEGSHTHGDASYDPQPYEVLAGALSRAGELDAARQVSMARFEQKLRAATTPFWEKALLVASKIFIGYGIYPFRLLWWFLGLVACGVVVAAWSRADTLSGFTAKLQFSVENMMPLLRPEAASVDLSPCPKWVGGFFVAQRILGLAIAVALIATLTLSGG